MLTEVVTIDEDAMEELIDAALEKDRTHKETVDWDMFDNSCKANRDRNDYYHRVIHRLKRFKRLIDMNAPKVIVQNEKRMVQEAIDALLNGECKYLYANKRLSQFKKSS